MTDAVKIDHAKRPTRAFDSQQPDKLPQDMTNLPGRCLT